MRILAASSNLDEFGHDPWWLVLGKVVFIFAFLVLMTLFAIWYERKVVAYMQVRPGPNRNGPAGLLQSLADGLRDRAVEHGAEVRAGTAAASVRPDGENVIVRLGDGEALSARTAVLAVGPSAVVMASRPGRPFMRPTRTVSLSSPEASEDSNSGSPCSIAVSTASPISIGALWVAW